MLSMKSFLPKLYVRNDLKFQGKYNLEGGLPYREEKLMRLEGNSLLYIVCIACLSNFSVFYIVDLTS